MKDDRGSLALGELGEGLDEVVRFGCGTFFYLRARVPLPILQVGRGNTEGDLPDPRSDVADRGFGSEGASEGLSDGFAGYVSIACVGEERVVKAIPVIAVDLLYVGAWSHSGPLCHAILSVRGAGCFTSPPRFFSLSTVAGPIEERTLGVRSWLRWEQSPTPHRRSNRYKSLPTHPRRSQWCLRGIRILRRSPIPAAVDVEWSQAHREAAGPSRLLEDERQLVGACLLVLGEGADNAVEPTEERGLGDFAVLPTHRHGL